MSSTGMKQYKDVFEALDNQGWTVEPTSRGHFKAVPPDKNKTIVVISTSDDPHAYMNNIRDLKRGGFIWPVPSKAEDRSRREPQTAADDPFDKYALPARPSGVVDVPTAPPETQEEKMDRLFRELKEAKAYAALAEEHAHECSDRAAAAAAALNTAERESAAAADAMKKKKAEFDDAFYSGAA